MRHLIDSYAWIKEYDTLGWTAAVIQGRTEPEVVSLYGGDPTKPCEPRPFPDAVVPEADFGRWFYLQTVTTDRFVVAIENNGWTGTLPEIGRRASAQGGRYFSVYWTAEGRWRILQAEDGEVTAYFDVVRAVHQSDPFDKLPSWIEEVDLSDENLEATCLAIMEQQTGVAFDSTWLQRDLATYHISDPDEFLKGVENAREP